MIISYWKNNIFYIFSHLSNSEYPTIHYVIHIVCIYRCTLPYVVPSLKIAHLAQFLIESMQEFALGYIAWLAKCRKKKIIHVHTYM